jgi:hypothetical protein
MTVLSFLETHSVALVLLSATTMFALIIIIKIHSVRTDLDRAIRALPKNSGNSSGTNFEGLNDQIEQMAVEIVALKNEGVSKSFVDDANALAQPSGRTGYTEITTDSDNIEQAIKLLRQGLAVDAISQRLNMHYDHIDLMSRFHGSEAG